MLAISPLLHGVARRGDRVDYLRLVPRAALRKESLRQIQFSHFDHERRRLTIFTKGAKVRNIPIVEAAFWNDL